MTKVRQNLGLLVMLLGLFLFSPALLRSQTQPVPKSTDRNKYWIDFKIDVARRSYTGSERVRWVNRGEKPTSVIYFHLYPNLRVTDPDVPTNSASPEADEPRLDIV